MKPIIGIISRSDKTSLGKSISGIYDRYRRAVLKAGGNPIVILSPQCIDREEVIPKEAGLLTEEEKALVQQQLELCDGIIAPGGTRAYDDDRFIIEYANEKEIPLLGICMGMQLMCNYENGNKNLPNETDRHKQLDEDFVHEVTIDTNSILYSIVKEQTFPVSSIHSYHVQNSGNYRAVGYSDDGLLEAIEKDGVFNIGVQWHPEKTYDQDIISQRLFEAFIKAAISKKSE